MNRIMILFFIFFVFCFTASAEILLLTDGTVLRGEIIRIEDDRYIVNSDFGESSIMKSKIKRVYYSEDEYKYDETEEDLEKEADEIKNRFKEGALRKKEKDEVVEKEDEKIEPEIYSNSKQDPLYILYRKTKSTATAFLVPGIISAGIGFVELIAFIPYFSRSSSTYGSSYYDNYFGYNPVTGAFAFAAAFPLVTGIIMMCISFGIYGGASSFLKKWNKKYSLSLDINQNEELYFSFAIKI